ncbi:MAG TPA: gliding motility protein GldM [Bacteroidales bacterium]|nr:gliding motility protein GldM [Bacteroidales bacterium]HRZ48330.1 gliding motility protein GldM [Bacteroidales bacterium]
MAGYKETPRQKMIGMMYLVLTAMLALNVSKDILQAFVTVNDGLEVTNKTFEGKNQMLYQDFVVQMNQQKEKVEPYYIKAQKAKLLTDNMVKYIQDLKTDLVAYTEFGVRVKADNSHRSDEKWKKAASLPLSEVKKRDSYDKPIEVMIPDQSNEKSGLARAYALRTTLEKYKSDMTAILEDPDLMKKIDLGFHYDRSWNKEIKREMSWEYNTFYHTVLAADVVILNKMIAEVRNAEAEIVTKLMSNITRKDFKFDQIDAKIVPISMMIPQGSQYEATLFVAAYDTKTPIRAVINGQTIQGDSGKVVYRTVSGAEGDHKIDGQIFVFDPSSGKDIPYTFSSSYSVFKPTATVAATNMNVFYRNLENPLSVSVPGVSHGNISVSISAGHTLVSQGGGKFIVKPGAGKEAIITVSAKIGDRSQTMGSYPYRIRNVPPPTPYFAGKKGGTISKAQVLASPVCQAVLEEFLFEGVKYSVTGFNFVIKEKSGVLTSIPQRGNRLDGGAVSKIQAASRGERIFIEEIKAQGPSGIVSLPSVILKLE